MQEEEDEEEEDLEKETQHRNQLHNIDPWRMFMEMCVVGVKGHITN